MKEMFNILPAIILPVSWTENQHGEKECRTGVGVKVLRDKDRRAHTGPDATRPTYTARRARVTHRVGASYSSIHPSRRSINLSDRNRGRGLVVGIYIYIYKTERGGEAGWVYKLYIPCPSHDRAPRCTYTDRNTSTVARARSTKVQKGKGIMYKSATHVPPTRRTKTQMSPAQRHHS